jgi:integrase
MQQPVCRNVSKRNASERRTVEVHDLDPLLFQRPDGRRITKSAVNIIHRKVRDAAGIEFWFRDWRHHAATTWAKAGIPVQQGVRAMGRSSPAMLKVYVDLAERDVAALSARQPGKETATPRLNGYKTEGGKNPTL